MANTKTHKLFHVDQRIIQYYGLTVCSEKLNISLGTLHRYKKWKTGAAMRVKANKEEKPNDVSYSVTISDGQ